LGIVAPSEWFFDPAGGLIARKGHSRELARPAELAEPVLAGPRDAPADEPQRAVAQLVAPARGVDVHNGPHSVRDGRGGQRAGLGRGLGFFF
jgi:hypothetical protein